MRAGEADQVEDTFRRQFKIDLVHVKAADRYFSALEGRDRSRAQAQDHRRAVHPHLRGGGARPRRRADGDGAGPKFLVQGTLYPDVIESGSDTAANIKSHHNVGGLPDDLAFDLVEPLRLLFKDEVRAVGEELGLPHDIVWRQPFPGPGLGVRIIGEVTPERAEILRNADAIVVEEIRRAGLYRELWQSFAVLPAVRTVGVMGDGRTYAYPIVIRAVTSDDAMTADWARLPYDLVERISVAHHQRGRRGQPGGARRHVEAPRHHRVGVSGARQNSSGAQLFDMDAFNQVKAAATKGAAAKGAATKAPARTAAAALQRAPRRRAPPHDDDCHATTTPFRRRRSTTPAHSTMPRRVPPPPPTWRPPSGRHRARGQPRRSPQPTPGGRPRPRPPPCSRVSPCPNGRPWCTGAGRCSWWPAPARARRGS